MSKWYYDVTGLVCAAVAGSVIAVGLVVYAAPEHRPKLDRLANPHCKRTEIIEGVTLQQVLTWCQMPRLLYGNARVETWEYDDDFSVTFDAKTSLVIDVYWRIQNEHH